MNQEKGPLLNIKSDKLANFMVSGPGERPAELANRLLGESRVQELMDKFIATALKKNQPKKNPK